MASISREKNGRKTIQFTGADGKRRSIRLGKASLRFAEAVKVKVEQLAAAAITGHAVDDETSRWVAKLDEVMIGKLGAVGLIPKRESATLKSFLDRYFSMRTDVKTATLTVWGHTRRNLIEFFGPDKPLRDINRGDAEEWRLFLVEKLSDTTVHKRCGFAKQFFSFAVKQELIPSNPFAELKSGSSANPSRYYFISRSEAEKVTEACPDSQWRLLFALCRYGGLRCPSETLLLRWNDINWESERMLITSPKTEHHPGGESRLVPLFPELKPYLEESFDLAEPGEFVITRYRNPNVNMRTQLLRIIKRAGLKPWPKLFQNLRSTRQTELEDEFPSHVVCSWIGNSEAVAKKHYLQVTDEHFEKAVQNPVQQPAVLPCNGSQADSTRHEKTPVLQGLATEYEYLPGGQVEVAGLEPVCCGDDTTEPPSSPEQDAPFRRRFPPEQAIPTMPAIATVAVCPVLQGVFAVHS
jgi:integrase